MALFATASGWILGLGLGQWLELPLGVILPLLLLPLAALLLSWRLQRSVLLGALATLGLLTGLLRVEGADPLTHPAPAIDSFVGKEISLVATVTSEPLQRGALWRVYLDVDGIKSPSQARAVRGGAVAWMEPSDDVEGLTPGDSVLLSARVELPPTFPDFDYRASLARRGITVALYRPRVQFLGRVSGPQRWLNATRRSLSDALSRGLPEPQASLAQAVLLGQRGGLTPELRDEWSRAGTAHLLSISGLHVSVLLGVSLVAGTALLGRRRYLYLLPPFIAIWAYAVLAGLAPPVQRAAAMGSLYLLAIAVGRQSSGGLALVLAAATMGALDPTVLGRASFQLSFAAMAGLVYLSPPIETFLSRITGSSEPRSGIGRFLINGSAASLGAVIGIAPLLSYHFGMTSLLSVPATLLALPALPLMLLTSALTALAGLVGELPGQLAGWLAWPWLTYLLTLSSAFARLPFAAVAIGPPSSLGVVLLYAGMALVLWRPLLGRPAGLLGPVVLGPSVPSTAPREGAVATATPLVVILALLVIFLWSAVLARPGDAGGYLRVTVLDVGQGDAILIQAPGGRRVLVDGGPDPRLLEQRLAEELPWWSRRIDLVVLTHPNADHLAGLVGTLDRRLVGTVLDPDWPAQTGLSEQWRAVLDSDDAPPVIRAVVGTRIALGDGATLEVLHPPDRRLESTPSDVDNNAVVLRLSYGRASFLLTADIFDVAEAYLVSQQAPLNATVLKVPHHGSANASSASFLEAVDPMVVVVSVGAGNRFGHPTQDALDRLAARVTEERIFRTDRDGAVRFSTDGERLWVETDVST